MLGFVLLALALADAPAPAPAHPITVTGWEPRTVAPGDKVVIEGSGFDQGTLVLVGNLAPRILERTATRLVFAVPGDTRRRASEYTTEVRLVTPGLALTEIGEINVDKGLASQRRAAPAPRHPISTPATAPPLVDETFTMAAGGTKTFGVDITGTGGVLLAVRCTGGEAGVSALPAGAPERAVGMRTEAGRLDWRLHPQLFGARSDLEASKLEIRISPAAAGPLDCSIRAARLLPPAPVK